MRNLHAEHERAPATGSDCAIHHFAEISAFARLRPNPPNRLMRTRMSGLWKGEPRGIPYPDPEH